MREKENITEQYVFSIEKGGKMYGKLSVLFDITVYQSTKLNFSKIGMLLCFDSPFISDFSHRRHMIN